VESRHRLSVVIMHHPSRSEHIHDLIDACQPLPVRVVPDPDPSGPPSPLRTAKRAWAAVADGATHHLVLQDDMIPIRGFAGHLVRAIAARPEHGISLSVQGTSPRNAYLVRRAALAGHAWAPTSIVEWTPTNGLVLPATDARDLAVYLADIPDGLKDDDNFVTPFCAERGLPVLVTVPNLIEHGDLPSLSGFGAEGRRTVTAFDPEWSVPVDHWDRTGAGPGAAPVETGVGGLAVELRESRCGLRFFRPGTREPLEHPHTWYWHDSAALVGIDQDDVVRAWRATVADRYQDHGLAHIRPRLTLEIWAAGLLTGALSTSESGRWELEDFVARVRHLAAASWLRLGLSKADRAASTPEDLRVLAECLLLGYAAGRQLIVGVEGSARSHGR